MGGGCAGHQLLHKGTSDGYIGVDSPGTTLCAPINTSLAVWWPGRAGVGGVSGSADVGGSYTTLLPPTSPLSQASSQGGAGDSREEELLRTHRSQDNSG